MKIRSVRPEFFTDSKMVQLSHSARLLYVGLWCYVDDEGRGEYLPKRIEGEIFPLEDVGFAGLWTELEGLGRVVRYRVEGQSYFYIPRAEDYQKPNRKYDSKLPAPTPQAEEAARTQEVSTARAHAVGGEGEGEGEAASDSFKLFHKERARSEVLRQQQEGLKVRSVGGLVHTLTKQADFMAESWRIWNHRTCDTCKGSGFETGYSPGTGGWKRECTA